MTRELAETFGMDQPKGALIAQVLPDSPAEAADLQEGDVVLRFNGKEIAAFSDLPPLVGASEVNESATLEVLRRRNQLFRFCFTKNDAKFYLREFLGQNTGHSVAADHGDIAHVYNRGNDLYN